MEYRLGNSIRIEDVGQSTELTCPKCNRKVKLSIFSNFNARLTAEFPLLKTENIYFLVCPECSALFGINEEKGINYTKGEPLSIGNYDLKELKKFDV